MRFGELGDGGYGLPRALCALAMTGGFTWGAVGGGTHGSRPTAEHFVGQGPCALPGVQHKTDGRTEASAPTEGNKKCGWAGRCGERTERCQWQKQRSERVAAVKISSVRRKAAQKFWAPQQGHRPLRRVTRSAVLIGRGDIGIGPYGGETEIHLLSGGRGRTPPLRRATRGAGKESPSHGFAVPAPFRQGGHGDGGCGLPQPVCALALQ